MTTVSAADMLGNDVIREEILQKLRENAARLQQEGTTLPPQASQDLISISDEVRRRLEEQKAAAGLPQTTEQTEQPQPENQTAQTAEEPPLLSGESASGVRVDISAAETAEGENAAPTYHAVLNGKDGSSFTLNFSGSVSIAASEDGLWSVYHADLGVTRLYGSDGSYTETAGNMLDPDGDIIVISTGADELTLGDGDNLVFALGDDAVITAGNGDNTVHVAGSNVSVTTGDGDDHIIVTDDAEGATISTGNGNDSLKAENLHGATVDLGDGDNTLQAGSITASDISMGNGKNVITGSGENCTAIDNSRVSLGDGDNFILVTEMRDNAYIKAGKGNNIIHVLSAESRDIDVSVDGSYDGVLVNYTYRDVVRNAAGNLTGSANASLEDLLAAALDRLEQAETRRRNETMEDITEERTPATIDERATEATQRASEASQEAVERAEAA